MNVNGDFPPKYIGSGNPSNPGLGFFHAHDTGLYRDDLDPNPGICFSTRGAKRMKISDNKIEVDVPYDIGTNPVFGGDIVCDSLLSSGTISCGTNSMTCGNIISSGTINSGAITTSGGLVATSGAIVGFGGVSGTSVHSSGTMSCVGSFTCGNLTSTNITANGAISCGTNALTGGPFTVTSGVIDTPDGSASLPSYSFTNAQNLGLYNTGTGLGIASGGTNVLTIGGGGISSTSDIKTTTNINGNFITAQQGFSGGPLGILTSGTISCGTNSLTCGPITASGSISSGTNSLSCGSVTAGDIKTTSVTSTGVINSGTNAITGGPVTFTSVTSSGTIGCGTNALSCGPITCGSITASGTIGCGTNSVTCGSVISSGNISVVGNMTCANMTCSSLTATSSTALNLNNNCGFYALNSTGGLELAFLPRASTNSTTIQFGAGGFNVRNQSTTSRFFVDDTAVNVQTGNLNIQTTTSGLQQKKVAVSGGTANGSFNSGVVLVAGTVTITNSYVTNACVGVASISTSGGVPGAYSIVCGSGTYTITSTSVLDTSTLNVFFIKGF